MGGSNFWEGQVENRAKTGKMLQIPGYLGKYFQFSSEYYNLSSSIFLAYNIHLFIQESQKKSQKIAFLYSFPTIPPTLHLSLFLGYVL